VAHYVQAYATPAQFRAALEMYRAFPNNVQFNRTQHGPNEVPLFLGAGAKLIPKIAEGRQANGLANVEAGLIPDSVHYLVADQPKAVADLIERYASM
jgi:hypothetical protein